VKFQAGVIRKLAVRLIQSGDIKVDRAREEEKESLARVSVSCELVLCSFALRVTITMIRVIDANDSAVLIYSHTYRDVSSR